MVEFLFTPNIDVDFAAANSKNIKQNDYMSTLSEATMYQAVKTSDASFDGVFFFAVKTTKIFCRPTCPARIPLLKNVEFFQSASEAVYAGYRPCKRCNPLGRIHESPNWVLSAIELVEKSPDSKIKDSDLKKINVEPERIRRYFKKTFGMTFHSYARGRRLGQAFSEIKNGTPIIEASMNNGYESTSGFRAAFQKAFGYPPSQSDTKTNLKMTWITTPLGPMIAAADEKQLYLLEFSDRRMLSFQLETLKRKLDCGFVPGKNIILQQIESELDAYFQGKLTEFKTKFNMIANEFQDKVWSQLLKIPYGKTLSYGDIATKIGIPDAQRAVGKANGENRLAIIVPCHRVIRADGKLCGYGGGIWRKQRLLEIESGQLIL